MRTTEQKQLPVQLQGYDDEETVALRLGVTVTTLARWRRLRRGPPVTKFGCHVLYRRESFEAWLLSCERPMVRSRRQRQAA